MRKGSLSPLLARTPVALYWMGFLLADGHFSETALSVLLGAKDENHLIALSKFIGGVVHHGVTKGYGGECKTVSLRIMHTEITKNLRMQWGIVNRKTQNPPNLSWLTSKEMLYVLIGFIDGDGCIKKRSNGRGSRIKLVCHSSWVAPLQLLIDAAHEEAGRGSATVYVCKRGFATVTFGLAEVLRMLKRCASQVPSLSRKWENIDGDFISTREQGREVRQHQLEVLRTMKSAGRSRAEMAKELGISVPVLGVILRELGLQRKKQPSWRSHWPDPLK